jgi:hypothetical protein
VPNNKKMLSVNLDNLPKKFFVTGGGDNYKKFQNGEVEKILKFRKFGTQSVD